MTFSAIHRRSFLSGIAAFLVLVTVGLADDPAPARDARRFEINFLTSMIDHHFGGVELAKLCVSRAIHPELQKLCGDVSTAQMAEIAKMQGWLQSWYGITHEPALDGKTQRQIDVLSSMSGAAFEETFLAALIGHHIEAINMSVACLNEAYHAEMLNMCAMMLGSQGDEIATMRIWLIQWYGITDPDRASHDE